MNPSRLKQHVCPACRANQLVLKNAEGPAPDHIESGTIECRGCGKTYPVEHGLPRVVPASNYAESFGFQWTHVRPGLNGVVGSGTRSPLELPNLR